MRETDRYLQFKKRLESVDAEIRYNGQQMKKLQKAYNDMFPMRYPRSGWILHIIVCSEKKAKTCRACPHNLVWLRYFHIEYKNKIVKSENGRIKKYKRLYDNKSRCEKIPWDYFYTNSKGEKNNYGFRRRSKAMRAYCVQVQKMKDRIIERRKKLLRIRMLVESTLKGLIDSKDSMKKVIQKDFEDLYALGRECRKSRLEREHK